LQPLKVRARVYAELLPQDVPCGRKGRDRVRLPARAIVRQHQEFPQALTQGLFAHELLQLEDDVALPSETDLGLDPLLEHRETKLVQPLALESDHVVRLKVLIRDALPERKRLAQTGCGEIDGTGAKLPAARNPEAFEPGRVKVVWVDAEHIARSFRHQDLGSPAR
jgi:hypothetical protein